MPTTAPQNMIVRVASSDLSEIQDLSKLLSDSCVEHGPITEIAPDEELALDFAAVIHHMHEIMLVVEAFVVSGTLAHWIGNRSKRKASASTAATSDASVPQPGQQGPAPSLTTINVNGQMFVINEKTDLDDIRRALERIADERR